MNDAFEDALIEGWEPLEDGIRGLPDPNDRHVVAAAVRGSAAAPKFAREIAPPFETGS
ncbi:hypothetical protein [Gordonia mangrovi]|uniref:hypothetical protein n=1 Tax=Gordonia mangrovi TaxID=2665643 RepID=UPI0019289D09|nr:hypothetical protein [Gordonia mangrovi]UVF77803.1 hypothetical protein NWF22_21520 [Gordonia mangrovi]